MLHTISHNLSGKHIAMLFVAAFLVRAATFYFYIDPEYRYNQPDTKDYHVCAISLAQGKGMSYYQSDSPIFWRTPGYPLLLMPFYTFFGGNDIYLQNYKTSHRMFLWLQILICSFLPVLIFLLAKLLTANAIIAWISALLSIVHLGFVLSSTYLMTDALSTLLFLIFLLFLFSALQLPFEEKKNGKLFGNITCAALSLSLLTWIRPMGLYVAAIALIFIGFARLDWRKKMKGILLFSLLFFGTLSPWFVRNYTLTGHIFFCPLWGPYTLTFLVPKIYQRLTGRPLVTCINKFLREAKYEHEKDVLKKQIASSPYISCKELICAQIANPWLRAYPWYFFLDWTIEMLKTTCDLYSGHLVNFARNNFSKEPPVEFLSEKLRDCLYKEKLPLAMRIIAWNEALIHLFILLGLFGGLFRFVLIPLFYGFSDDEEKKRLTLWLKTGIFIALVIGMTGGFGYARLRLPVEALMIILALDFWAWLGSRNYDKKSLRPMARKLLRS